MKKFILLLALIAVSPAYAQNVGIGTITPLSKVHIFNGSSGAIPLDLADLTIETNRETYLHLLSPFGEDNGILFGNSTTSLEAAILYIHGGPAGGFQFRTGGNQLKLWLTEPGVLRFNGQLGSLIDLYKASPFNSYGFGVIPNQLQVYAATETDDILFGFGTSEYFTEKFRMKGTGNFGIGVASPTNPLSFAASTEKKISLYPGASGDAGFAVGPSLLTIYSDHDNADIAFGFDDYDDGFTERMRIKGNGNVGIGVNPSGGKLVIHSGSSVPQLVVSQSGNADYSRVNFKNANSGTTFRSWDIAAFTDATTISNDRMNFFITGTGNILSLTGNGNVGIGTTSPAHKLQVEGSTSINGNLGISNSNPTAPLTFAAALGKKITLYPGGSGDAGFGITGNRLQIFSDNANADIAFGFDAAGVFNERFAVKPNAAIAVNGNIGGAGQLLQSNGNAAAEWRSNPVTDIYNLTEEIVGTAAIEIDVPVTADIPGLTKTLTLTKISKVIVQFMVYTENISCGFCGENIFDLNIFLNGNNTGRIRKRLENGKWEHSTGTRIFTLNPGTHTIKIVGQNLVGPPLRLGYTPPNYPSVMTIQVVPQN